MRFIEEINVLRYYKPFIEAGGGIKEVRKALAWSIWYAVKWWEEIFRELGLSSIRENTFARSLFISLRLRGFVKEDGQVKKRPDRPEFPTNSYALEFVELHESFDRLGAVNVATNKVGENILAILYSTMLSQGWYKILRHTFLKLVNIQHYQTVFEPIVKEGQTAMAVLEIYRPRIYIGFDYRQDNIELAASMLNVKPGACGGEICIFQALSTCEIVKSVKRYIPEGVEAVLMLHTLYWLIDPVRELWCAASLLTPGGRVLIGQQVVESTPGLVAIVSAMGAKHAFSWKGVEQIAKAAGLEVERRYLKFTPYYIAIWRQSRQT